MAITPQTNIRLLHCPIELDNKNQINFNNAQAQYNYFHGITSYLEIENCHYQRKDNTLRYPAHIDSLYQYNYLMYQNENYSNKWFYAYIIKMEYINDNMTLIYIKTDVFQTWQFDIIFKKSFVEREHVSNDGVGLHTVPEGLEFGDYIVDSFEHDNTLNNLSFMVFATDNLTQDPHVLTYATNVGGVPMAGGAYIATDVNTLVSILNDFANLGRSDSIYAVYAVPTAIINNTSGTAHYSGQSSPNTITKTFNKPTTLNGYSPKNRKLLAFPYCFVNVSNNNGSTNSLKYELFHDSQNENQYYFQIKGVPVPGGSIKCIPLYYANSTLQNEDEGLIAGKFPTLSWSEDLYTNWLTQNGVNVSIGISKEILGTSAGNANLSTLETLENFIAGKAITPFGGFLGVNNSLNEVYQHSLSPTTAKGNTNGGDINVCSNINGFSFYKMSIKQEFAQIIDNYFEMFGYKVNKTKIPSITGRTYWNYLKTISINIEGNIPQEDLQELKNIFNSGLTIWHNTSYFLDYSQNNH